MTLDGTPSKFQHPYGRHLALFLATLATTTWAGAGGLWSDGASIVAGLWYSLPVLTILGAHEFGHYALCRKHNVAATLPFFIPAPPPLLTGTFGAVIRIRELFPSRRALFDIGVAGPIAGFVAMVPFLYFGLALSHVERVPQGPGMTLYFGEPLLLKAFAFMRFGTLAPGYDIFLHPMGFAAWVGMLVTALNLMPFGQLDGGHLVYALIGRRAVFVSMATFGVAIALAIGSLSWIAPAVMMGVMAFAMGFRHPPAIDEDTPLDAGRTLVALGALVIFVVCFIPNPIETLIR